MYGSGQAYDLLFVIGQLDVRSLLIVDILYSISHLNNWTLLRRDIEYRIYTILKSSFFI